MTTMCSNSLFANLKTLTILHMNDAYEIAPVDGKGGLARVKGIVDEAKQNNGEVLFFHAGDFIAPSLDSHLFRGRQMIDIMNRMNFDAVTIGNHEFEYGPDVLREHMAASKFQYLTSNILDEQLAPFGGASRTMVFEKAGTKIGVFAVTTPDTAMTSFPGPNIHFEEVTKAATSAVGELKAKGAQYVIALTHLALNEDVKLANEVKGLNLIIGGHDHHPINRIENGIPIVKAGTDAQFLGRIDIHFDESGQTSVNQTLVPIDTKSPTDETLAGIIDEYKRKVDELMNSPLAETAVTLDTTQDLVRSKEMPIGNLIADIFRERFDADISIVGGGTIRGNRVFPPGVITLADVRGMIPWPGTLAKIKVSGAVVVAAIEHALANLPSARFPHLSKDLKLIYDLARPVGSRIVSLTYHGGAIEPRQTYTVVIDSWRLGGGDGFAFPGTETIIGSDAEILEFDTFANGIRGRTLAPKVEGRVQCVDLLKGPG